MASVLARRCLAVSLLIWPSACAEEAVGPDGGPAPTVDASTAGGDAGSGDAGSGDAGPRDAGGDSVDAGTGTVAATRPNILLIIADDLGLDASRQYPLSQDGPTTPRLDALAESGVVFDNMWATPACTTTRASILTGQHGVNSGVTFVPGVLRDDALVLQRFLRNTPSTSAYAHAVFGKWHVGGARPAPDHPNRFGVETYAGNVGGNLQSYTDWELVEDQTASRSTTYHTTAITDLARDWVLEQTQPWFLWVAYSAPHSPFHLPPAELHTQSLSGEASDIASNRRAYFLAAIEAMDTEIGRLLDALPPAERERTIVMFLGDNGTPRPVLDRAAFGNHGKNTLYEGGVRVPFVVSGAAVTRPGARESALVNTTDLFATVATLAGEPTPRFEDGTSFAHLITGGSGSERTFNYTEFESDDVTGWAVRNLRYKLIVFDDGRRELYDVQADIAETSDLLLGGQDLSAVVAELEAYGRGVRGGP